MSDDSAHLSIGEVLTLIQEEFPDVSISKIRFLESQGLLDPERTPSGYRKFYPEDIDRLRWILVQQRDRFLPLRVIKERLDEANGEWPIDDEPETTPPAGDEDAGDESDAGAGDEGGESDGAAADADEPAAREGDVEDAPDADRERTEQRGATVAALQEAPGSNAVEPEPEPEPSPPPPAPERPYESLTREELARAAGADLETVGELESYGFLSGTRLGPATYFGRDDVPLVRAVATFMRHGVEVRHLRMYKIAAEREAGFFEQLVVPLLKQRNPESTAKAVALVDELTEIGEQIHTTLLRAALRSTLP